MSFIESMTGFGRAELINEECHILWEIRSVNSRYLELNIRMPHVLNSYEGRLRKLLKSYIDRGKIEIYMAFENYSLDASRPLYNKKLAGLYVESINNIARDFNLRNELSAYDVSKFCDVITADESPVDKELWEKLEQVLNEALLNLLAERRREGEELRADLFKKLDKMNLLLKEIEKISPDIVSSYKTRLYNKLNETLSSLNLKADESRILTEVAIFADKVSTDEEMVRLESHIAAAREKLTNGGTCGKELDFIAQEMNREANTMLSKSGDLKKSDLSLNLKSEIEKIREQVQNIA